MTEMYLNDVDRRRSRTGCFAIAALAVLLVVAVILTWSRRGDQSEDEASSESDIVAAAIEKSAANETPTTTTPSATRIATATSSPAPSADDPGPGLIQELRAAREQEEFSRVRELGWRILEASRHQSILTEAETILGEVHTLLVFSPHPMEEKVDYTIQRGDTLAVLARRFGTTVDMIQKGNRLSGAMIRVGDRLRILQGTFSLEVSKTSNDLVLYLNDRFFKRYPVGTGEYHRTPEGEFKITDRIAQPTWWRPDGKAIPYGSTNNLLGTHWLSIDVPGYGLHGTWEPETIGYQSSAGCVRMLNDDIEELYTLLPVGVRVVIKE